MTVKLIRNAYEASLTMTAVLLCWAAALWLEGAVGLHADVLVLAVALTLPLASVQRTADTRGRLMSFVLLPAVAGVSILLGHLVADHYAAGAAVFTLAISLPIWIRRFGPAATKAGTLMTLPLIALLVMPGPTLPPKAQSALVSWGWAALIGVLACGCVRLVQALADRLGPWRPEPAPDRPRRPTRLRPRPSTRMAVQMAAAVAGAFALGRLLFDQHWPWVVLTAYVAASGNRGRNDVARKGVERFVGACAGTVLATGVAMAGITGRTSVVLMFVVLALALWLRPLNYAYWAAGMTTALSLLLGYYGQDAQSLLLTRLEAIALGAALAVASAWWLLPVPAPRRHGPDGSSPRLQDTGHRHA
ncbi:MULTISPECIES: FUSC family protein [unclassified Streptomyces]|uniref:FUSC family protein n=1 Tax=unclassified Streptomyces TaxID=2593676 RepID=UPI002E80B487|nr:FUSC family protein [Streptomyces sp. NBC_00589]WTI36039.1 FUSC family protein [Streptomyces sp. NBC_00775]WUB30287.1 FUSC family protein [Streptomyces sp. NBC_00589]